MTDNNARERAESLFDREKRREAEIADALTQEQARRDAVIRIHASAKSVAFVAST